MKGVRVSDYVPEIYLLQWRIASCRRAVAEYVAALRSSPEDLPCWSPSEPRFALERIRSLRLQHSLLVRQLRQLGAKGSA